MTNSGSIPEKVNAMTVDVEDYFQVSAFERHVQRSAQYTDAGGGQCRPHPGPV